MLYENIKALCDKRGISIARLERESGLGNATVRGWINGIPKADTVGKVARYFGVSIEALMNEDLR